MKSARRSIIAVLALMLIAAACSSDSAGNAEAIATNDGGILVKPPDVLEGEPEAEPAVPAEPAAEPSENATPLAEFVWFDGRAGSTADFAGKPTVLNFWASTCAACIAEMPEFEEVFQALGDDVAFVGMNVADERSDADRLAEQTGVTYPLAADPQSAVFRSFFGFVMPTTAFLTADGEVAYTWSGVLTGNDLRILIDEHILPGSL